MTLRRGGSLRPGGRLPVIGIVARDARRADAARPPRHPALAASARARSAARCCSCSGRGSGSSPSERTERIRLAERAEVAARIHDSVLQTLALIQRHAVGRAARHRARPPPGARAAPLAVRRAATARPRPLPTRSPTPSPTSRTPTARASSSRARATRRSTTRSTQLVLAAREAMTNAAKHSTADEISVYAEAGPESVAVFVRDRGVGFDPAAVGGRPARHQRVDRGADGSVPAAARRSSSEPGQGTEVELTMPTRSTHDPRRPRRRPRALPRRRARRARRRASRSSARPAASPRPCR